MFNALKEFFIGVLIAVGVVSTPISVPPEVLTPEAQIIVQEKEVQQVSEASIETQRTVQNESRAPVRSSSVPQAPAVTPASPVQIPEPSVQAEPVPTLVESVNGQCGGSSARTVTEQSAQNLCSQGEPTDVIKVGSAYEWKCLGLGGGRNSLTCRAPIRTDGVCGGLVNTIVPNSYDPNNLCAAGTAGHMQTVGSQLQWTCRGEHGGNSTQCYAFKVLTP